MKNPPVGRPILVLVATIVLLGVTGAFHPRPAAATATKVGLLAPAGSRVADELRRELEVSAFTVVVLPDHPATADLLKDTAQNLLSAELPWVVAVRADERQVMVLSRAAGAGGVQASFNVELDPNDRPTRRRACLTVVEYLRVLGESDDMAMFKAPGAPAKDPADKPTPRGVADQAATDQAATNQAATNQAATNQAAPSQAAANQAATNQVDAADDEPPGGAATEDASPPALVARPSRPLPWTMGVGTTLDLSLDGGQPAGHVQFMWVFPIGPHLAARAQAQWPVLGAEFRSGGTAVRMWTFGAAFGMQYSFMEAPTRWRPFLGVGVGNRIALTESSSDNPLQSRSSVTPSAYLGFDVGLRYALGPRVQLFSEVEVARDWMIPTANRLDYEKAQANAASFHTSVGVLFEY